MAAHVPLEDLAGPLEHSHVRNIDRWLHSARVWTIGFVLTALFLIVLFGVGS